MATGRMDARAFRAFGVLLSPTGEGWGEGANDCPPHPPAGRSPSAGEGPTCFACARKSTSPTGPHREEVTRGTFVRPFEGKKRLDVGATHGLDDGGGHVGRPGLAAEIRRVKALVGGDALDRLHQESGSRPLAQ